LTLVNALTRSSFWTGARLPFAFSRPPSRNPACAPNGDSFCRNTFEIFYALLPHTGEKHHCAGFNSSGP